MSSTAGALRQRFPAHVVSLQRQLVVAIGHTGLVLLLSLGVVLLGRRFSGRFDQPLGSIAIILAAAVLEFFALGLRRLFQSSAFHLSVLSTRYLVLSTKQLVPNTVRSRSDRASPVEIRLSSGDLATTTTVLASIFALSIPGSSPIGVVAALLIIVGAEIVQRLPFFRLLPPIFPPRQSSPDQSPAGSLPANEINEPEIASGLVHQLTRIVEDGSESIHALLKAEVNAHDRLAIAHVAFCPPLSERPVLSAHALDCEDAEIHITQVESFGARLEVRLPSVSDAPHSVIVEILGTAKASQDS